MNDGRDSRPGSGGLAEFGFDDDRWLNQLRRAETPALLGALGRFELMAEVSRGGQGIVYRARDPRTGRLVAVKRLVAGSMATSSMRHRFEREIEAAAALNHPNIVTLYGPELVDGQSMIVMEWIEGDPITTWAAGDGPRRSTREIVEVFIKVCDAIRHAHQRGVIHRDLKPSNILVDAFGEPHVLDFGIAKLNTAGGRVTVSGQFVGTPAYASPEHVRGRAADVDVRSDVYSLGVVFYELLCGRLPYPVAGGLADVFDAIQRTEPFRPSRASAGVDGDLEAIVLKALAKEPHRRYQSVEALRADLARFLAGEAIDARGTRFGYLLGKAVRRHKVPVVIGAAFAALLLGYAVSLPVLYLRADRQAHRAQKMYFALHDTLASVSPYRVGGSLEVSSVLQQAVRRADTQLADEPEVEAAFRHTIALAYSNLWMWPEVETQSRRAVELLSAHGPGPGEELATCLELWGRALACLQDPAAETVLRDALEMRRHLYGPEHPLVAEAHATLGLALWHACSPPRGREAETQYRISLGIYEQACDRPQPEWARALYSNATYLLNAGRHGESEPLYLEALEMHRHLDGEDFLRIRSLEGYGRLLWEMERFEEAEAIYAEAVGLHPPGIANDSLVRLQWARGAMAAHRGRTAEARRNYLEALASRCEVMATRHPALARRFRDLAARVLKGPEGKEHDEAIELLDSLDPELAERWRCMTRALEALGPPSRS